MCYSPINIINPSKYVSLRYRDRYVMQVPCGKCAACRTAKSNEWTYRLYHHAMDTFGNGFVLFDTLTYNNQSLPHISDFLNVSSSVDYPCFSSRDLRLFVADLRQRCKRQYKSNFSYFIASEYGTSEHHLHRPHYHALFFVKGPIKPLEFSRLVSAAWHRGRTDGFPWRSSNHVLDNVFDSMSAGALRSLKYVCKYIQKDCTYQKNIDSRLDLIMYDISKRFVDMGLENWSESSHYWRIREMIARKINQFHRQSTFLGASALSDIDLNVVFNTGSLYMPDNKVVVRQISLPTYYKRKLFYELIEVDGSLSWQPTELGYQYLEFRQKFQKKQLEMKFDAIKCQLNLNFDSSKLSDYVLSYRGRFKADKPSTYVERLEHVDYINYVNRYDKEWFCRIGLSREWLGNSSIGYKRVRPKLKIISEFISENVYFNNDYENILSKIFDYRREVDASRQRLYEEKQRLFNLMHCFFG